MKNNNQFALIANYLCRKTSTGNSFWHKTIQNYRTSNGKGETWKQKTIAG